MSEQPPTPDDPYAHLEQRAAEMFTRLMGPDQAAATRTDAPLTRLGRSVAFGDVWNRPHLTIRDRRLVTLTILALEARDSTIAMHVRGALQHGDLDGDDLDELALQIGVYGGFPRASNFGKLVRAEVERHAANAES